MRLIPTVAALLCLIACSAPAPQTKSAEAPPASGPGPASTSSNSPVAGYIELSGFRLAEEPGGNLKIKFVAVNHSDADLQELKLHVRLTTSNAKPGEAPITEFDATVPPLGPQEDHDVAVTAPTKLKLFEIPDWQFLRANFDILSGAQ